MHFIQVNQSKRQNSNETDARKAKINQKSLGDNWSWQPSCYGNFQGQYLFFFLFRYGKRQIDRIYFDCYNLKIRHGIEFTIFYDQQKNEFHSEWIRMNCDGVVDLAWNARPAAISNRIRPDFGLVSIDMETDILCGEYFVCIFFLVILLFFSSKHLPLTHAPQ